MRSILFALFLTATANECLAQERNAPTQAEVAAAREFVSAFAIESGLLPKFFDAAARDSLPQFRQSIANLPFYAELTPTHRAAADSVFPRLPAIMDDELSTRTAQIVDARAGSIAALFSEPELRDITTFLRTDAGRATLQRGLASGLGAEEQELPQLTPDQENAIRAFRTSSSGRAFYGHFNELGSLMNRLLQDAIASMRPTVEVRFESELCAAMEDQCPPDLHRILDH